MPQTPPSPAATDSCQSDLFEPLLDAERLDVYRIALEFQVAACQLLPPKKHAALRDQLERASLSIVLNIAEGAGRRSVGDKNRFYAMARGSATECAAILDILQARGLTAAADHRRNRSRLVRIVQMLTKLVQRAAVPAAAGDEPLNMPRR